MSALSASVSKGLYGTQDGRANMHEVHSLGLDRELSDRILKQAKSVACLVSEKYLDRDVVSGSYSIASHVPTLSKWIQSERGHPLGEHEIFREELVFGNGTAFLIGKQLALTAAHLVCRKDSDELDENLIDTTRLVFGYAMLEEDSWQKKFEKDDVYRIEVVAHQFNKQRGRFLDWAVLKLDREVTQRHPLNVDFSSMVTPQADVYMLGHPSGLPLKLTKNAEVKKSNHEDFFTASLDAFKGNSGSPVFDVKHDKVIGMLFEGNHDYIRADNYQGTETSRMVVHNITSTEIQLEGFEKCHKITTLGFLKAVLHSIDIPLITANTRFLKAGLNLEGLCPTDGLIVIPRGSGKLFDISTECCNASCPSCDKKIKFDDVNTIVLSSCTYTMDGMNTLRERIQQTLTLLDNTDKRIRFDITKWLFLEIDVKALEVKR